MPVRSGLAFLPTGIPADGTENRLVEVARRRVNAFLEAAANEPGTAGAQARRCQEIFSTLPDDRKAALLSHPFAQQWALERAALARHQPHGRQDGALEELAEMLAVPAALADIEWDEPIRLRAAANGRIPFGGSGLVLTWAEGRILDCVARGGMLRLSGSGPDAPVEVNPRAPSPPLRRSATVGDGRIEVDACHPRVLTIFRRSNASRRVGPYPHKNLAPVDPVPDGYLRLVDQACVTIGRIWPELLEEIERGVRLIAPFDGVPLGFTDGTLQGAIFLKRVEDDLAFAVEHIVHESSHARLYALERLHGLFRGTGNVLLESPWRRDPRPLSGVYHGMFVFARLYALIARCDHDLGIGGLVQRGPSILEQFDAALRTLEHGPELQAPAQALLDDMVREVDALR